MTDSEDIHQHFFDWKTSGGACPTKWITWKTIDLKDAFLQEEVNPPHYLFHQFDHQQPKNATNIHRDEETKRKIIFES